MIMNGKEKIKLGDGTQPIPVEKPQGDSQV